jgi:hypothetical protein
LDLIAKQVEAGLIQLSPNSVHAVLWLQTHFPKREWDALLNCQAAFEDACFTTLMADARRAGLNVDLECSVRS